MHSGIQGPSFQYPCIFDEIDIRIKNRGTKITVKRLRSVIRNICMDRERIQEVEGIIGYGQIVK
jgi:hypothetical protein